jgi:SdrD B-like protein
MSQDDRQTELHEKTQHLLQGPLKHVRAAALAAALLPLASVVASPAAAQGVNGVCPSGGLCGFVWNDANKNGIQDDGSTAGIVNAVVTVVLEDGTTYVTSTDADGFYFFDFVTGGTVKVSVQILNSTQPSPNNVGDDTTDSDGVSDGFGSSVATVTFQGTDTSTDFGFFASPVAQPGTGTPGYWKNHPEAWPVNGITVGGITYTKEQAIAWLERPGKDKTITMFSSLVPAMLNVMIGNDASCVSSTIDAANDWMKTYGPVGRGVHASSFAWKVGEPLHRQMDNYNNGMLCAPHRD